MNKKSLTHVQSCCLSYLNLMLFYRSRCRRRRRCLSSLLSIYEMRCFTVLQVYYTLCIKNNTLPDGQREQDNQTEIEPL